MTIDQLIEVRGYAQFLIKFRRCSNEEAVNTATHRVEIRHRLWKKQKTTK